MFFSSTSWTFLDFLEVCCLAAEMLKDGEHIRLCTHLFLIWFFGAKWRGAPGMRLHRLRKCVSRNAGGIMSGTVDDVVQSVTSLNSTKERIKNRRCEKIVFSPLWDRLLELELARHASNYCLNWELPPPCTVGYPPWSAYLATCKILVLLSLIPCCCGFYLFLLLHPQSSFAGVNSSVFKQKVVNRTFTSNTKTPDEGCCCSPNNLFSLFSVSQYASLKNNTGSLVRFCTLEENKTNTVAQSERIQRLISYRCGDGELSLVSHCRDRVRPWLPQHPVSIVTPCGLAQEQPQQPGVGHHLHHTAAAAPAASPRAQVSSNDCLPSRVPTHFSAECTWDTEQRVLALAWLVVGEVAGEGWDVGLYYTGILSFKAVSVSVLSGIILRFSCWCAPKYLASVFRWNAVYIVNWHCLPEDLTIFYFFASQAFRDTYWDSITSLRWIKSSVSSKLI